MLITLKEYDELPTEAKLVVDDLYDSECTVYDSVDDLLSICYENEGRHPSEWPDYLTLAVDKRPPNGACFAEMIIAVIKGCFAGDDSFLLNRYLEGKLARAIQEVLDLEGFGVYSLSNTKVDIRPLKGAKLAEWENDNG